MHHYWLCTMTFLDFGIFLYEVWKLENMKIIFFTKCYFTIISKLFHYFEKINNVTVRRKWLCIFFVPTLFISIVSYRCYFRQGFSPICGTQLSTCKFFVKSPQHFFLKRRVLSYRLSTIPYPTVLSFLLDSLWSEYAHSHMLVVIAL